LRTGECPEERKTTGDDRRRTHDMNSANWIPDLFMKRVINEQDWTLFSPNDVPDLHDLYGEAFEKRYEEYEAMTRDGRMKLYKRLPAVNRWRQMPSMLFETGHPWFTFKDPCNLRSPQQHVGVVHSSNLCTEITLNTNQEEIAVCNLGSVNLAQHIVDGALDRDKLASTVKTAVRMLDNVIDINYYSVPQAERSNMKHRPVGLGIMGAGLAHQLLKAGYDVAVWNRSPARAAPLVEAGARQADSPADAAAGAACLRINPGNIGREDRVREVISAARDHGCSMRIGVNAGSLEKHLLEKSKTVLKKLRQCRN